MTSGIMQQWEQNRLSQPIPSLLWTPFFGLKQVEGREWSEPILTDFTTVMDKAGALLMLGRAWMGYLRSLLGAFWQDVPNICKA